MISAGQKVRSPGSLVEICETIGGPRKTAPAGVRLTLRPGPDHLARLTGISREESLMATQNSTHTAGVLTPRPDRRRLNGRTPPGSPVERRFWMKVDKDHPYGCWQWTAALSSGYGVFVPTTRAKVYAHRWSYEALVGPIPDGLEIDHLCRNRACVNPAHLEPVTPQVNVLRGMSPGALARRRVHCNLGHPYSQYGIVRGGRRVCRLCKAVYGRAYVDGFRGSLTPDVFFHYSIDGDDTRFLRDTRKWKRDAPDGA